MNATIRAIGPEVLLTLPVPAAILFLDWSHMSAICDDLRRAWQQAKRNEAAGVPYDGLVPAERRAVTVGRRGKDQQVALIFDRRLDRLRLPWEAARSLWKALLSKVREGDSLQNWKRTVDDQKLLIAGGLPIGITPPILAPALRQETPGGIPPTSVVGTPTLIGHPKARTV